jgi:phage replication O-like protein O
MFNAQQELNLEGSNIVLFPTDQERSEYQLGNGNWFQLLRKVFLDLYCKSGLSGHEVQVVSAVILLTYGRKKPCTMSEISASDISVLTGLKKQRIWQILADLISRNILKRENEKLGYNKYISTWINKKEIKTVKKHLQKTEGPTPFRKPKVLQKTECQPSENCRLEGGDSLYSLKTEDLGSCVASAPPPPVEKNKPESEIKKQINGTRIPDEWVDIPDEWKQYAEKTLLQNNSFLPKGIPLTALSFLSYWKSASGQKARKKNWRQAWINWFSNDAKPNKSAYQASKQASSQTLIDEWANQGRQPGGNTYDGEVIK